MGVLRRQLDGVVASLDDSTERMVEYLSSRDLPITVLLFQVFASRAEQFLSRTWLLDPVQAWAIGPVEKGAASEE